VPDTASKIFFTVILTVAIMVALAAIFGNPTWSYSTLFSALKDFQAAIGGGLALVGIWLGFHGNRRRDERLRRQDARALALALYGELTAALITCNAFVGQVTAALGKHYPKDWLDQEIIGTNFAPHVRTKVFEANADKLGLLGEPLVGGAVPEEHLIVEIVAIFDQLVDYSRIASKEQPITRGHLLAAQAEIRSQLKDDFVIALQETREILRAYIYGGLPAAIKAARSIIPARKSRHERLGKELGIPTPT
jgi:hypothetical protein